MKDVVIVSAARTPVGKIGGTLKDITARQLLAPVLKEVVKRAGIELSDVDEIIVGQTKQNCDEPNLARVAALMAGFPEEIPAYTVHRQCGSSIQSTLNGFQQIQTGYSDIVVCAGAESQSTAQFYIRGARFGVGNGTTQFVDPNTESQIKSQPEDVYGTFNMIRTADNIAAKDGITREECDEFALRSQQLAIAAIDSGRFKDEIVPVVIPQRKKDPIIFDTDEFPKRDTSLEKMAKLKAINPDGVTTAGNASGRNDGASAVLLMSAEKAAELGIKPMCRILGAAAAGCDPRYMGLGPVVSSLKLEEKVLKPLGLTLQDVDLWELNEAFAAQALGCIKELNIDIDKVNVNGGAIAIGHPLGATGTRLIETLAFELQKRDDAKIGVATLCIAGGLGMAMAIEKI